MIRPTEDEKDLQKLERLPDTALRAEFANQMRILRQKVFNRVRPKMLNGKAITGETFIELCEAYTKAINGGSVPCIESAWTYLCKNECQRAYQEALDHYSQCLTLACSSDITQLKALH